MTNSTPDSARRRQLLDLAYGYVLERGLGDLSLRPLARSIGTSPRVLLYLFENKDGLVRALLSRARAEEVALLEHLRSNNPDDLTSAALDVWAWLADDQHRGLLTLWAESYARSLVDPAGPWGGFASSTVSDWLELLAATQPPQLRETPAALVQRTAVLAVLRGALLDLLATGDPLRTTAAVQDTLEHIATSTVPAPNREQRRPAKAALRR
jgi:AcrR family transcriptional regulator